MGGQLLGVATDAVEERRLPAAEERKAEHVHAGCRRDAADVADRSVCGHDLVDREPGVVRAVAGRPDDRTDGLGDEVQLRRSRGGVDGARANDLVDLAGEPASLDPVVEAVEELGLGTVGCCRRRGEVVGEADERSVDVDQPAGEPDTGVGERPEVE